VVSVGYMADGVPGAIAGWIAMASPSLLVILLVGYFGKRAQHPRVRSMLQCVVLASAALLVLTAIPIGREALDGPLTIGITVAALPLLITKRLNTLWIIGAAAALSFTASVAGGAQTRRDATPMLVKKLDATHGCGVASVIGCQPRSSTFE
jgi:chromate transporter